jgi:hypothetical protein
MASPIEQIATAIATAIADAIEQEKGTLEDIAKQASSSVGSSPYSDVGNLVKIITGVIGTIPIVGELTSVPLDVVDAVGGAAGEAGMSFGFGYLLGNLGFTLLQPLEREAVHAVEALFTSQIFDPQTAAGLVAQGIITGQVGLSEAQGSGFDSEHFNAMVASAQQHPDVSQLLTLLNLTLIGESDYAKYMNLLGYSYEQAMLLMQLQRQRLSTADLALAQLRGIMDPATAENYAQQLGMVPADFATLIGNTGEPPGLMQLLEAYRRGFIDQPTLEAGIRQSRVRDEWIPTVEALRYTPMSTADAARAYVQNYLAYDDAAQIAQENGLEPDHWQYIAESYGRPLAHGQMIQLYYRGLVTREQFDQAMRESDIKDKYIDASFELGVKLPGLWEIVNLLKDGQITTDMASTLLLEQGYQTDFVADLTKHGGSAKAATAKTLTVSNVMTMYDDGLVSRDQAITQLEAIGYTSTDTGWLLAIADAKQQAALAKAETGLVRTQYERRLITEREATDELTRLGVDPAQASRLVTEWSAVRLTSTKTLTEAQVMKVLKDGLIGPDDAMNRLLALGYSETDAGLLIGAYG